MVAQHAIGWEQLFQGRFDNRWSWLQEDYYYLDQNGQLKLDRKYFSGNIWLRKLIAPRHGTNKDKNHAIRCGRLLIAIQALYADAPHMLAVDRDVLAEPLVTKLKKHPTGLELWLRRTCNIIQLSRKDALLAALKLTHKTLAKYFTPRKKKATILPDITVPD
jgi:hypothetical protein